MNRARIRVLLADDSDAMRCTIVRFIQQDPSLEVVGDAPNFSKTLELAAELKPDILVLDLHMPDESRYSPEAVKLQVLQNAGCILAISIWNDQGSRDLANSFGAKALLDKVNLFVELIPSIKQFCASNQPDETLREIS